MNVDNATEARPRLSIEKELSKVNQIIAEQLGLNLYEERSGFSQHQIYELAGAKDYVSAITFSAGSDSAQKYGQSLTVRFVYTLEERKSFVNNIYALDNEPYVKVIDLLHKLDWNLSNHMKETRVKVNDIVELLVVPLNKECNTFYSKELREPNIMKIPMSVSKNGEDIEWIFGFLQKLKNEDIALTPEEESEYLAYKIILDPKNVTQEERDTIFSETNTIKSPMVTYHYLMWKNQVKKLDCKEINILRGIKSMQFLKRLNQTEEALKNMGLSLHKMGDKYPQKLALLLDRIMRFHEIRYNDSGKYLLYCNFNTFLHVYLRHVEELKVDNQFGDRDKFQLKEENVMAVMEHVMRSLNDEYQSYKEKNPKGDFFRRGSKAYYYNGDYYNVFVKSDGSISTFYKGSGNKPQNGNR